MGERRRIAGAQELRLAGVQVVWLPKAVENLEEIRAYIAKQRPAAAERVAQKIRVTVAMLQDHPQLGKPALRDGFRQIQVAGLPFVIPYKVAGDRIIIVRVFHNRQRASSIFSTS